MLLSFDTFLVCFTERRRWLVVYPEGREDVLLRILTLRFTAVGRLASSSRQKAFIGKKRNRPTEQKNAMFPSEKSTEYITIGQPQNIYIEYIYHTHY